MRFVSSKGGMGAGVEVLYVRMMWFGKLLCQWLFGGCVGWCVLCCGCGCRYVCVCRSGLGCVGLYRCVG